MENSPKMFSSKPEMMKGSDVEPIENIWIVTKQWLIFQKLMR